LIYRFNQFQLDTDRRSLFRDGEPVPLSTKGFELLCRLVESGGKVLSKDELLEQVWPGQFVEENNLSVQISALRKLLSNGSSSGQYIATISGRGYSFVAPVERSDGDLILEQRTFERIIVEHEPGGAEMLTDRASHHWPLIAAGFLVIAIGSFFAFRYYTGTRTPKINSVAILPFTNETGDTNNEYLSDGLAESVIYSLSQVPDLRVMSRGSVFRYKGTGTDAKTIGSELNVNAVLVGRVTQRGDDIKISAELVSAADDTVIWGEQFARKLSDIEKLQTDISGSIASKLRFKLTGISPRVTENTAAYNTYLLALYHWNKRTPDNIVKSIDLFKQAIALDPQFNQAYGALAMAYEVQDANGAFSIDEAKEINAQARAAADKALELNDNIAEAHAVLGMRRFQEWDFAGSDASFKRAIAINPNFATAHQWYAEMLGTVGRSDEAETEIKRAYELDPFSRAVIMNLGLRHMAARRTDDAIAIFKRLIESEPDYPMSYSMLGTAYEEKGLLLDALEPECKADVLLKIDPPDVCEKENEEIREIYKREGAAGYWRKNLEISRRLAKKGIVDDVWAASAYFRVGDRDKGFELLEKAFDEHSPDILYIKVEPPFRDLGDDPRYQSLLKRIGLVQ
jgi:TolB-like protein/DNA-binding winged helix-turn-helix (wHTH) protein/tetratricopeptide (TPR) repeat protein